MPSPHVKRVPYSKLRFNATAQRYIGPDGKFIKPAVVREIIDDDVDATKARMQATAAKLKPIAEAYRRGDIDEQAYLESVQAWRDETAKDIKALHLGNAAAGKGGFHTMEQSDFGRAGALIREQYKFLNDFAAEVAQNPGIVTGDAEGRMKFEDRVGAYAEAGRGTYARVRDQECRKVFKSKYNKLEEGAHHCKGPKSCPAMTEMGRVAVDDPDYVVEGFRACGPKCKCETVYSMDELEEAA